MAKKKYCSTPGCTDKPVSLGFCSACYAFHKYWEHRSLKAKVEHNNRMKKQSKRKRSNLLFGHITTRRKAS